MIIAATGDVHSPQYFEDFVKAVDTLKARPDLFLMVGDMINRGAVEEFEKVYNVLFGKITCPIVSCFGNNEFQELRETIRKRYPDIKFLDDESLILRVGNTSVGIIGTTGSLDSPTPWQRRNVPDIERIYQDRISFVDRHLQRIIADFKILLVHYAPTYKTLEGENPRFYAGLGSQRYEPVIIERKPSLVLHGHSHKGTKVAWVDTVPIFNVALPLNREIVVIDTEKDLKPGIAKFV
ncbi:MAG: metallophosphoesterase [Candidatus Aenigmarchaeota archaeon]|nr:metallophosphoesterase [Candidatus Aenigmarchaeota archaeon]